MKNKLQSTNDVLAIFKETGALLSGHFFLTSGLHSSDYFQCARVLQHPRYCQLLAENIIQYFKLKTIDVVLSPAIGGIVIGQEVGRQLGVRTIFAERKNGAMCLRRGFKIKSGERVLICEDVVTTGGSVFEVIELVKSAGADVAGVGYIVDRSNGKVDFSVDQYAVIKLEAKIYSESECPLCKQGQPIEKPGSRQLI
jgi:orotate phosphoribosyltransferase